MRSSNPNRCKGHSSSQSFRGSIIDMPTKENPMADATKTPETKVVLHSEDPILSRSTHIFGQVEVFPPNADPKEWPNLSFLFMSKHGREGADSMGLCEYIKAKYVHKVYERPHFINNYMRFGEPDIEEYVPEPEESWKIDVPDRTIEKKDFKFDD